MGQRRRFRGIRVVKSLAKSLVASTSPFPWRFLATTRRRVPYLGRCGPAVAGGPHFQPYPVAQGRGLLAPVTVMVGRADVEHADPGQPARGIVEDNVLNRRFRLDHFHDPFP